MEPEVIGINEIIGDVAEHPDQYIRMIADMTARNILKGLRALKRQDEPLTLTQMMVQISAKPTEKQIKNLQPLVADFLTEYTTGKKSERFNISNEMQDAIARTCMTLLGHALKKKGKTALGHYIHDTNHTERLLSHPERAHHMERGIIPDNRICRNIAPTESEQLWIGHDTKNGYSGKQNSRIPNIITRIVCTNPEQAYNTDNRPDFVPEKPTFNITAALEGDYIHHGGTQTLVFRGNEIAAYKSPEKALDGFISIKSFPLDFDKVESIESKVVHGTGWYMYRVSGKSTEHDDGGGAEEGNEKIKKITLCINPDFPEESYATMSKRYNLDRAAFTIDSDRKKIIVLTKTGKQEFDLPFNRIFGVHKKESTLALYFTDNDNCKKKMTFETDGPIFSSITESEEEFFTEKK